MYPVGTVVRVAQGLAIVRSRDEEYPHYGTTVLDESLEEIGRVVDVFGPVDRPYLAVSPADDVHLPALLGTNLYGR